MEKRTMGAASLAVPMVLFDYAAMHRARRRCVASARRLFFLKKYGDGSTIFRPRTAGHISKDILYLKACGYSFF